MSSTEELYEAYVKDPRIPCNWGAKCYQKNQVHRDKYKHPPRKEQGENGGKLGTTKRIQLGPKKENQIRPRSPDTDSDSELPKPKKSCLSPEATEIAEDVRPVSVKVNSDLETRHGNNVAIDREEKESKLEGVEKIDDAPARDATNRAKSTEPKQSTSEEVDVKTIIKTRFLVEMPDDFYKFYKLCEEILPKDPSNAFKAANLVLVGPYDILNGKLLHSEIENKEKYLIHWRYFYDPPEFQTILKGNDKDGLHYGYWRDEPKENPIFVAKNISKNGCKIKPVAETVFGAVDNYLEEKLKVATPFDKAKLTTLRQRVKKSASLNNISMDKNTDRMRARERRVVARTFHGAGIVVPYNKKTQLGYRELSLTDTHLKKILNSIENAEDDNERANHLTAIEEAERLATIAADECDFGTCLELGHDLFSNGGKNVQSTALRMLSTAYTLLNRLEFLEIVKAHCKNRKTGSSLSIVQ